jgi:hypothetical protein
MVILTHQNAIHKRRQPHESPCLNSRMGSMSDNRWGCLYQRQEKTSGILRLVMGYGSCLHPLPARRTLYKEKAPESLQGLVSLQSSYGNPFVNILLSGGQFAPRQVVSLTVFCTILLILLVNTYKVSRCKLQNTRSSRLIQCTN